jgi:GNAT superfamily N-acetyltransferase
MSPAIELPGVIFHRIGDDGEIRRASVDDLLGLLALYAQMHDEAAADRADGLEEVLQEISEAPHRALLVATLGGDVVGTLDFFVMANLTHGGRPWAGIENLVVDGDHRRQGIGGALMRVAVDLASHTGCYKLQLVSHQRRDAAHMLYSSLGFDAPVRGYRRYL